MTDFLIFTLKSLFAKNVAQHKSEQHESLALITMNPSSLPQCYNCKKCSALVEKANVVKHYEWHQSAK